MSTRDSTPGADPRATPERILLRLEWQVIRRLDGLLQGDYRSLFYGYGIDFADLREYQPEDDIRYIDWNVTARMDSPYVRQYVEDREITGWFLLDLSPSMDFGGVGHLKRERLVDLVTTLARLLIRHGNRVGSVFFSGQLEKTIPARGGRMHLLHLINSLLRQPVARRAPLTNLSALLSGAAHLIRRRSLIFVISDFISAPGWEHPLRLLAQHHEVLAIRLWDPSEMRLPDVGPVILEDSETGDQVYVDTHDARFRMRYEEAARKREKAQAEAFKRAGVDVLSLSTGEDMVHAIARFARGRKKRGRVKT